MLALPCELIVELSRWLSVSDLGNLRLACKQLAEVLATQVFWELSIDLQDERVERDLQKLETLAQGYPLAAQNVRRLYLGWLNPRSHWEYNRGHKSRTIQIRDGLDAHLFKSLKGLQGLKSVSLNPVLNNEWQIGWGSQLVQTVLNIPALEHFSFCVTPSLVQHPFPEQLPSLRSLGVVFELESSAFVGEFISELRRLVGASPSLSRLSLTRVMYGDRWNFPTKEGANVLSHVDSTDLPIRELSIRDVPFPIAQSLHHFRNLKSLTLECSEWKDWGPRWQHPDDAVVNQSPWDDPSICRAELWNNLRQGEIWLSTIVVDHACPGFLHYIESYSQLLHLTIGGQDYATALASDAAANRFYQESLRHHTTSLISLRVHPQYEGAWSFSLDNWRTIKQCCRLVELSLVIDLDKDYPDDNVTDLTTVLDLSRRLPSLRRLSLKDTNSEWFRNVICARGYDFEAKSRRLHAEASSYYCAPIHGTQLPELTISGEYRYRPVIEKDIKGDCVARYIVVSQPLGPLIPSCDPDSDSD